MQFLKTAWERIKRFWVADDEQSAALDRADIEQRIREGKLPCLIVAAIVAGSLSLGSAPAEAATCRQGDPPLTVSSRTSCAFAGRVVTRWMNEMGEPGLTWTGRVYSSTTRRTHRVNCWRTSLRGVRCSGANGISIRFQDWITR
jgi:hypothetical protein